MSVLSSSADPLAASRVFDFAMSNMSTWACALRQVRGNFHHGHVVAHVSYWLFFRSPPLYATCTPHTHTQQDAGRWRCPQDGRRQGRLALHSGDKQAACKARAARTWCRRKGMNLCAVSVVSMIGRGVFVSLCLCACVHDCFYVYLCMFYVSLCMYFMMNNLYHVYIRRRSLAAARLRSTTSKWSPTRRRPKRPRRFRTK